MSTKLPPHPDTLPTETFTTRYGNFTLLAGEDMNARHFRRGLHYNQRRLEWLLPRLRPGMEIVEVGAHCGTDTVPYAKAVMPTGTVLAFEPQRVLFELLCRNVKANSVNDRVVMVNAAVAHCRTTTSLAPRFNDGSAKNRPVDYAQHGNFGGITLGSGGEPVDVTSLDAFEPHLHPDFLHIDAEGAERMILYGAKGLLQRCHPMLLWENNLGSEKEQAVHAALGVEPILANWDPVVFLTALGYRSGPVMERVALWEVA